MLRVYQAAVLAPCLALGLVACGGGAFIKDAACAAPVTQLSPDLTAHIASGSGDGTFIYAPVGEQVTTVTGSYDLQTGDFGWTELASAGAWFERAEVTGYGYAARNGDLDIVGERVITDIRQLELRQQFRTERTGCTVVKRVREWTASGEREDVETGTYLADSYRYDIERFGGATERFTEGSRNLALDFTETITAERSGYMLEAERTGNLGDGDWVTESEENYTTRQGQVKRTTTRERSPDGSQQVAFDETYASGATVTYEYDLDYYGNGEGTISSGGAEQCRLTFTAGECRYSCNNGDRGVCYLG